MEIDIKVLLRNKAINEWRLFWLISLPMCIVMAVTAMRADLSTASGVSGMIQFSVRWAVPFIYLVVAASSVKLLFPGPFTAWWLHNRKYFGLCFAVAMAWQGLFIFIMSTVFREYYFENVYLLRDELEGSIGYIFLFAMVVTSFKFGNENLNRRQWSLIHKSAVYFLWAYPFSVYWWNLFYYDNPAPIDYIFYWGGFLAFTLRIAAWGKKRSQAMRKRGPDSHASPALKVPGIALIAFGLLVSATGLQWREPVTAFLTAPEWSADLVLWLPYWPFEPYLSLFVIGLGTMLFTHTRTRTADQNGDMLHS